MQQVRVGAAIVAAVLVCAAPPAAAAPAPIKLSYRRERGAARCPGEAELRAGVARRLGRDPFSDDATRALEVRVAGAPPRLVATIELAQGARRSRRTLRSTAGDCAELASAVELAVSLAIDPLAASREPGADPAVEILAVDEPAPPASRPLPERLDGAIAVTDEPLPPRRRGRGPWHVGVGSFLTVGSDPDLVIGVRLELGARAGPWAFTIEPWMTLPSATSAPGGHVSLATAAASLTGCRAAGPIWLCAHAAGGVLQAIGEGVGFERRARVRTPFGAAGGRVLFTAGVYPGISVRATVDLLVPVLRTELHAESSTGKIPAWSSPWLLPSLGLGFVGHFP
jgi:hypothetical protein